MKMASCRWIVPPIQGKGESAAAWRAVSVPACPGHPSLPQLLEAVPEAPWGEGWLVVTWALGRAGVFLQQGWCPVASMGPQPQVCLWGSPRPP